MDTDQPGPERLDAPALGVAAEAPEPLATVDLDRLHLVSWWMGVGVVWVLGAFAAVQVVAQAPLGVVSVAAVAGIAAATITCARLMARRLPARRETDQGSVDERMPVAPGVVLVAGAVLAMGAVHWLEAAGPGGSAFAGPALATGGLAVAARRGARLRVVAAGAAITALLTAALDYGVDGAVGLPVVVGDSLMVALVGAAMVTGLWSWETTLRLDRGRRLEAELAVANERLRFAGDLHDIQGQHLQVIALQSELAARLADADPAATSELLDEIHTRARDALAETRGLVQGYRRTSLGDELTNATRVLAAADIDARLEHGTSAAAEGLAGDARHLLGLVAREATTNVLRHSHADQARLVLQVDADRARLGVRNNGTANAADAPARGLATLARRLEAAGGALDWQRDGEWFAVSAQVPVTAVDPA